MNDRGGGFKYVHSSKNGGYLRIIAGGAMYGGEALCG